MFGQDRAQMREVFFHAWRRHRDGEPLEGVEQLIVGIALRHPEYHPLLDDPDRYRDSDYLPELGATNPFLHMGMHIAIEEQLAIDQPRGIQGWFQRLRTAAGDAHAAQHRMMECLGEMLWQAQRNATGPDEKIYFACLARQEIGK